MTDAPHDTPPTSYAALLRKAMEALTLFADKCDGWEDRHPAGRRPFSDATQISHRLGDFRRARAVAAKIKEALG